MTARCAGPCHRPLVPHSTVDVPEGHARVASRGMCTACYSRAKRRGTRDQYAAKSSPATAQARLEDLEFLLRVDHNSVSVAHRAGFTTPAAAQIFLRRHGRPDLAQKIARYAKTCDVYSDAYGAAEHGATHPGWRAAA